MVDDWDTREQAPTIGYYAFFELTNGFRKAIYWSKAQMESHAIKYSMGYRAKKGYTFWEKDFDAMAYLAEYFSHGEWKEWLCDTFLDD